jgi:hypothetical protein
MKRLARPIGALIVSIQMTGCGGAPAPTVRPAEDPNLPSEVREYEARRDAERTAKKLPPRPIKPAAK